MEYQKITKLLGNKPDKVSRFITKKWMEVLDQSGGAYSTSKQIRFKTSMLRSDLCDYNDALLKELLLLVLQMEPIILEIKNRLLAFKNNAPTISCISKINRVLIENAEDLDIVMPMYNLLEYNKNYSKTSGSLWNYYRDELSDETNDDNDPNKNVINSKSFNYKKSITRSIYNLIATAEGYDANKEETKKVGISVPLKYLSNFWRTIDTLLINCEVSLTLSWSANCVITSLEKRLVRAAQEDDPGVHDDSPTGATFKITDTKFYVPVVTLSAENDNKLLEQL